MTINEARDDLVMAFTAAGIPLAKLEHPCIQGFLKKPTTDHGCYVKDDRSWQQCYPRITERHVACIRSRLQKAKYLDLHFLLCGCISSDRELDKRRRREIVLSLNVTFFYWAVHFAL